MGFERYVDYAIDVPLYFVKRGETYHDVAGASFRDLLDGKLAKFSGERAILSDWANHLSTIFPEVRLKRYLEMRGADAGPLPLLTALPALFAGLFYEPSSLDAAWDLVKPWSAEAREKLRADVPCLGLEAIVSGRRLREIAGEVLNIARAGLASATGATPRAAMKPIFWIPSIGSSLDGQKRNASSKTIKPYGAEASNQLSKNAFTEVFVGAAEGATK